MKIAEPPGGSNCFPIFDGVKYLLVETNDYQENKTNWIPATMEFKTDKHGYRNTGPPYSDCKLPYQEANIRLFL